MISIRRNTFETNSSSTHAMGIPKTISKYREQSFIDDCDWLPLQFNLEYFGWDIKKVNHLNYLYTAMVNVYIDYKEIRKDEDGYPKYAKELTKEFNTKMNMLKNVLKSHHIRYRFEKVDLNNMKSIDHSEDLGSFMDAVFKDEDTLWRYLVGGLVYTGTDNISEGDIKIYKLNFGPKYDTYYKGN